MGDTSQEANSVSSYWCYVTVHQACVDDSDPGRLMLSAEDLGAVVCR